MYLHFKYPNILSTLDELSRLNIKCWANTPIAFIFADAYYTLPFVPLKVAKDNLH